MEAIIAGIAGFGGALLYSVLQPTVAHFLSRRERIASREDAKNRELRQMVGSRINHSRTQTLMGIHMQVDLEKGVAPLIAKAKLVPLLEQYSRELDRDSHVWQTFRIRDTELRSMCDELNRLSNDIQFTTMAVTDEATKRSFLSTVGPKSNRVEELQEKIVLRMDDLGW